MIVVVTDQPLGRLLTSGTAIDRTWPQSNGDVRVLVTLLQVTFPSLAEVIETRLVALAAANNRTSIVTLTSGSATVVAVAQDEGGEQVREPKANPEEVVRLDIVDVQAEGRSGAEVAR
jgi:hypothetical protein